MDVVATHATNVIHDTVFLAQQGWELTKRLAAAAAGLPLMQKALGNKKTSVALVVSALIAIISVVLVLDLHGDDFESCPALTKTTTRIEGGPQSLLEMAEKAHAEEGWTPRAKQLLLHARQWSSPQGRKAPIAEMHAQLRASELLKDLTEGIAEKEEEAAIMVERAKITIGGVGDVSQQCEGLHGKLKTLRTEGHMSSSKALVGLGGLSGFEKIAQEAFATLHTVENVLQRRMEEGDWDAEDAMHEVPPLRIRFRQCMLKAVKEARAIAGSLSAGDESLQRAQRCRPDLLTGIEELAFAQAEAEDDPGITFSAGLLLSEAGVSPSNTPFFGATGKANSMVIDPKGYKVPDDLMKSEQMMLQSYQNSYGPDETERAALSAIRLCQHAKHLMNQGLDGATEWRYKAGAELAEKHGRDKLASHSMSQLSYFLVLKGRDGEALKVADEAIGLSNDPLASYLQVQLRRSLGRYQTSEDVEDAAEQLAEVEGKLLTKQMEETRTALQKNIALWKQVQVKGTYQSCFILNDAAEVMTCLLAKIAYEIE